MDKPRDVIARELPGAIRRGTTIYETGIVQRVTVYPDIADAIIAALNDAGYTITPRADGNDRLRELRVWIDAEQTEVLNTLAAWEAENAYGALHADHVQHGSLMGRDRMAGDIMGHIDAMLAAEPEPNPAPYVVTDAMVEAACVANVESAFKDLPLPPLGDKDVFKNFVWDRSKVHMRAALEAAERVRRGG